MASIMGEETVPSPSEAIAYEGQPVAEADASAQMLDVKPQMMLLAWMAFGLVAVALAKILWKPVLQGLEAREKDIREAQDAACKSRAEVAGTRRHIRELQENAEKDARERIETATRQSSAILETAQREAAAKAEATRLEAERQIAVEREGAVAAVQAETLRTLGPALERVLAQTLTDEQKRTYQEAMLRELKL